MGLDVARAIRSRRWQSLIGDDLTPAREMLHVRPPPDMMARLLRLHETISNLAESVADFLATPEVGAAIERELVGAMISSLAGGLGVEPDRLPHNRRAVMHRFEEFVEAEADRPVHR